MLERDRFWGCTMPKKARFYLTWGSEVLPYAEKNSSGDVSVSRRSFHFTYSFETISFSLVFLLLQGFREDPSH